MCHRATSLLISTPWPKVPPVARTACGAGRRAGCLYDQLLCEAKEAACLEAMRTPRRHDYCNHDLARRPQPCALSLMPDSLCRARTYVESVSSRSSLSHPRPPFSDDSDVKASSGPRPGDEFLWTQIGKPFLLPCDVGTIWRGKEYVYTYIYIHICIDRHTQIICIYIHTYT